MFEIYPQSPEVSTTFLEISRTQNNSYNSDNPPTYRGVPVLSVRVDTRLVFDHKFDSVSSRDWDVLMWLADGRYIQLDSFFHDTEGLEVWLYQTIRNLQDQLQIDANNITQPY